MCTRCGQTRADTRSSAQAPPCLGTEQLCSGSCISELRRQGIDSASWTCVISAHLWRVWSSGHCEITSPCPRWSSHRLLKLLRLPQTPQISGVSGVVARTAWLKVSLPEGTGSSAGEAHTGEGNRGGKSQRKAAFWGLFEVSGRREQGEARAVGVKPPRAAVINEPQKGTWQSICNQVAVCN